MHQGMMSCFFILICLMANAQTINVRGVVSNKAGKPILNATVMLTRQGLKDTTGMDGAYTIVKPNIAVLPAITPDAGKISKISIEKGVLHFSSNTPSTLKIEIFDLQGNLLKELSGNATSGSYRLKIMDNSLAEKLLFIRVLVNNRHTVLFRYLPLNSGRYTANAPGECPNQVEGPLARIAVVKDTLKTTAAGYITKTLAISSYDQVVNIPLDSAGGNDSAVSFSNPWAGVVWNRGGVYLVYWYPAGDTSGKNPVDLYLYKGTEQLFATASGVRDNGSYLWTVPAGLSGNNYRIGIVKNSSGAAAGLSDTFTIADTAEPVFFTSPSQGAVWSTGLTYQIKWNRDNPNLPVQVTLHLYKGSKYLRKLSGAVVTDIGTYDWVVPSDLEDGTDYRISFSQFLFTTPIGFSDTFTISTHSDKLNVYSPEEGSSFATGALCPIKWTANYFPFSARVNIYLYKESTQYLKIVSNSDNSGTFSWSIPAGIITDGNYRIGVARSTEQYPEGFSRAFTINGTTPDAFEPDDNQPQAHPLMVASPQTHNLTVNDKDWVSVPSQGDLGQVRAIKITGSHPAMPIRVSLYGNLGMGTKFITSDSSIAPDSSAVLLFANWLDTCLVVISSPSCGAYTARVDLYDTTDMKFDVTSPSAAELTDGQTVAITWKGPKDLGGLVDIVMYGPVRESWVLASNATNNGTFSWNVKSHGAGNYYIGITSKYYKYYKEINGFSRDFTIKTN
jgi:hypothetical protein